MQNQLEKALSLSRRTGDRLIVFDTKVPERAFVVMPLDDYEKIVIGQSEVRGLTENELLDRINRDIAVWKSEQNEQDFYEEKDKKRGLSERPGADKPYRFSEISGNFSGFGREYSESEEDFAGYSREKQERSEKPKSNHWKIPSIRKQAAEEVIEEDRQYLEEVRF